MPVIKISCLLVAVAIAGCGSKDTTSNQPSINVLVAASTRNAIEEIAKIYRQNHPFIEFRISSGSSNNLARQILAGAPADIFLSANPGWSETIEQAGRVDQSVDLLTNRLVLIVPTGNPAGIQKPLDLLFEPIERIAIAGKNVPAGIYAEQVLTQYELFESLTRDHKLVRGSDVRITLAYVERGEVDAGIVYATDACISPQVEVVWKFDPQLHEPIVYPAALLRPVSASADAEGFFGFLRSIEAGEIFRKYGFRLAD